ncbi:MAG: SpoIID/LytB domain-containing protein [Aminipila sp.]
MKVTVKNILSTIVVIVLIITACVSLNLDYARADSIPEYIKIGLKYGSSSTSQYDVTFANGVKLGIGDSNGFTELAAFQDVNKVTISLQSGSIQLIGTKNSGETIVMNASVQNANCIMPYNYENGDTVTFGNSKYRGGIMFNVSSGSLTIINFLPMEQYLYGVINGELSKSFPIEALKAQAVAARSFAVCKLGTHNSYGFDLCASTHCQVYKGYNDEYPETITAVDQTKGETINYEGKTVAAFFFKNSGGYTQDVQDVWGSNLGYLKAVKDEYSPSYPWSQSFTFSELASKLSSAGYNIGTVTNVSIIKRNQSGAVETIQVTGTSGIATLQKEKIRSVLGSTVIKSTMFSLNGNASTQPIVDNSSKVYVVSRSLSSATALPDTVYVINKSGVASSVTSKEIYVHNGKETKPVANMNQTAGGNQITNSVESVSGGNVTFTGFGYGHGIGMPQDSAVEMAKKGFTYMDILKYYYTDITID